MFVLICLLLVISSVEHCLLCDFNYLNLTFDNLPNHLGHECVRRVQATV